jgi:ribosomal protein S18 acetylase RimI-like enzyme
LVTVERLGSSDAQRLVFALESLIPDQERGGPVPPTEYLARLLASPVCYVFLAWRGAQAVGYLSAYRFPRLEQPGQQVYLFDVLVVPRARHRGVGRGLVDSLLDACRRDGVGLVWAGTALDNVAAQRTFEAAGGRRVSETYVEYHFSLAGPGPLGAA